VTVYFLLTLQGDVLGRNQEEPVPVRFHPGLRSLKQWIVCTLPFYGRWSAAQYGELAHLCLFVVGSLKYLDDLHSVFFANLQYNDFQLHDSPA